MIKNYYLSSIRHLFLQKYYVEVDYSRDDFFTSIFNLGNRSFLTIRLKGIVITLLLQQFHKFLLCQELKPAYGASVFYRYVAEI